MLNYSMTLELRYWQRLS